MGTYDVLDHEGNRVRHGRETVNGVRLRYMTAGSGDPVELLQGSPRPRIPAPGIPLLTLHSIVVAPDTRSLGDSQHPTSGYDTRNVAEGFPQLATALGHDRSARRGGTWLRRPPTS